MERPRIGIAAAAGAERLGAYRDALAEAGGEPVWLGAADAEAARCAGFVLPGGPDFVPPDPGAYPPQVRFRPVAAAQLALDRALLARARAEGRPALAVCYGMQLLALECGGTLVFDLPSERPEAAAHALPRESRHPVVVEPGTR